MAKKKAAKKGATKKTGAGTLEDYCRSLAHTTEDIKWGDNLIFSVGGKIYAGFDTDGTRRYAFKCDEQGFLGLIQREGIIPAPYSARFFWVKVMRPGALKPAESRALLRRAYELIVEKLPAKKRAEITGTKVAR